MWLDNITIISGHDSDVINGEAQIVVFVGMAWFYFLVLMMLLAFVLLLPKMRNRWIVIAGFANTIIVTALLAVGYMYLAEDQFVYRDRDDGVPVKSPLVVLNALIWIDLTFVGCWHCGIPKPFRYVVTVLASIGCTLTALASFSDSAVQWPGWVVGCLFVVPIPFVWMGTERRPRSYASKYDVQVVAFVVLWVVYGVLYGLLQLTGHSFVRATGLSTTHEMALMLVLHTMTLPLFTWTTAALRLPAAIGVGDE